MPKSKCRENGAMKQDDFRPFEGEQGIACIHRNEQTAALSQSDKVIRPGGSNQEASGKPFQEYNQLVKTFVLGFFALLIGLISLASLALSVAAILFKQSGLFFSFLTVLCLCIRIEYSVIKILLETDRQERNDVNLPAKPVSKKMLNDSIPTQWGPDKSDLIFPPLDLLPPTQQVQDIIETRKDDE